MSPKALILEDDLNLATVLGKVLRSMGFNVEITHQVADARRLIRDQSPELMLIDINLPDGNGLDLMAELQNETRGRFIVISGNTSQQSMIKSIKSQAADVMVKPVDLKTLKTAVNRSMNATSANEALTTREDSYHLVSWIEAGESQPIRDLRTVISHATSQQRSNVVIEGDEGSDKYSVARLIHKRSRRNGACIRVFCASEQDDKALERFFGTEDPITGECLHKGYLEQAVGGTLVLDDVIELNRTLQSRIMAFLESGRYTRVNGIDEISASTNLVAISRTNSQTLLESGRLRHDLYFRMASYVVRVPRLSQCTGDTLRIAEYFIAESNKEQNTNRQLSDSSRVLIESYEWPGNVLELKNRIEQAFLAQKSDLLLELKREADKPSDIQHSKKLDEMVGTSLWNVEKKLLYATLDHFHGNKEQTANTLGISLKTLYNRLNAYE